MLAVEKAYVPVVLRLLIRVYAGAFFANDLTSLQLTVIVGKLF